MKRMCKSFKKVVVAAAVSLTLGVGTAAAGMSGMSGMGGMSGMSGMGGMSGMSGMGGMLSTGKVSTGLWRFSDQIT